MMTLKDGVRGMSAAELGLCLQSGVGGVYGQAAYKVLKGHRDISNVNPNDTEWLARMKRAIQ